MKFARRAKIHGQTVVDEDVEMEIFLFHEQTNEEAIEASEKVPVEKAEVVADHIISIIGELDALPLALAAPLAFDAAEKDFPRHQLELFEAGEEVGLNRGWD
jgi:hypothetical protein